MDVKLAKMILTEIKKAKAELIRLSQTKEISYEGVNVEVYWDDSGVYEIIPLGCYYVGEEYSDERDYECPPEVDYFYDDFNERKAEEILEMVLGYKVQVYDIDSKGLAGRFRKVE